MSIAVAFAEGLSEMTNTDREWTPYQYDGRVEDLITGWSFTHWTLAIEDRLESYKVTKVPVAIGHLQAHEGHLMTMDVLQSMTDVEVMAWLRSSN